MWEFTQATTVTTDHPTVQYATTHMVEQLKAKGLPARIWKGNVVFGVSEYWGCCRQVTFRPAPEEWPEPGPDDCAASLTFDLYFDAHKRYTITQTVPGEAASPRQSLEYAVQHYLDNVFDALRAMASPAEGDAQFVEGYSPSAERKTRWRVFTGAALWRAGADGVEAFATALAEQPPIALVWDEAAAVLAQDERMHWVSVYGCRQRSGEVVNECTLDNLSAEAASRRLAAFRWPESDAVQSFRQFFLFNPLRRRDGGQPGLVAESPAGGAAPEVRA